MYALAGQTDLPYYLEFATCIRVMVLRLAADDCDGNGEVLSSNPIACAGCCGVVTEPVVVGERDRRGAERLEGLARQMVSSRTIASFEHTLKLLLRGSGIPVAHEVPSEDS